MNEKDLEYFCAAYKYRNISHASSEVYITPQGLSKAIHRIEEELGVGLFIRTQTGIEPTPYADKLYLESQSIISSLNQMKNSILSVNGSQKRELALAFTLGVIDYLGMDFLHDFNIEHPDIKLDITQNTDAVVDRLLDKGEAIGGIIAGPIDTVKYEGKLFTSHKHCLVINKSHPLSKKSAIAYKDLDGEPIALEGRDFRPYHNNMNRFLKNGIKPNIVIETTEIESTHRFASNNEGIGLSVDFCAFSHPYENTVIRPFEDDTCVWETYFVVNRKVEITKDLKFFMEYAYYWIRSHNEQLFTWKI